DLAARQRAHRARPRAMRTEGCGRTDIRGLVPGRRLYGTAPAARIILRVPAPAWPRTDALSGRLLSPGVGERSALSHAAGLPGAGVRSRRRRNPAAPPVAAGLSRRDQPRQSLAQQRQRRSDLAPRRTRRLAARRAQIGRPPRRNCLTQRQLADSKPHADVSTILSRRDNLCAGLRARERLNALI